LNKSSGQKQYRVIAEHQRAVNRICFHPSESVTLLSASQDGTMRLWDLRSHGSAKLVFEGKSESARDVMFNPVQPYEFAAAFENGTIQVGLFHQELFH
jgi:WD40 repeat protein